MMMQGNMLNLTTITILMVSLFCYQMKLTNARAAIHHHNIKEELEQGDEKLSLVDALEIEANKAADSFKIDFAKSSTETGTIPKAWMEMDGRPASSIPAKLHNDITLECQAVGSPPPMIYWLKNGKRVENVLTLSTEGHGSSQIDGYESTFGRSDDKNGFVMSTIKSKLVISCIRPEDEGLYECVANNGAKEIKAETVVNIEVDDKSEIMRPECERKLDSLAFSSEPKPLVATPYILAAETLHMEPIGNNIVLPCQAAGFPTPTISWLDAEGATIIPNKKFQVSQSGSLLIHNLDWQGMGEYTCVATNKLGSDVATTFLYPLLKEPKNQ